MNYLLLHFKNTEFVKQLKMNNLITTKKIGST